MATKTWNNSGGGLWNVGGNWSPTGVPTSTTLAAITNVFSGTPYTVEVSDAENVGTVVVGAADATLWVDPNGIFTAGTIDLTSGTLEVEGTIIGATIVSTGGALLAVGGTLQATTWDGPLQLATADSDLTVTNSFTVLNTTGTASGTIDITGSSAELNIGSSMTLNGNGLPSDPGLLINAGGANTSVSINVGALDVLTLGPSATLSQTAASSTVFFGGGTIVNNGTITVNAAGGGMAIDPTTFVNANVLSDLNGDLEFSDTSFTNSGVLSVNGTASETTIFAGGNTLTNSGMIEVSGGLLDAEGDTYGGGQIFLSQHGTAAINNTDNTVIFLDSTGTLVLGNTAPFSGALTGFQVGNTIELTTAVNVSIGTVIANVSQTLLGLDAGGNPFETLDFVGNYVGQTFSVTSGASDSFVTLAAPTCFLAGTRILGDRGEVNVERLAVGDRVRTLSGDVRRIVWIGTGRVLATRGRRNAATPVIVRKGALADNVPNRELRITKAHALYIDDVLVPVEFLVNHRTIVWDDHAQEVTIYHIELETHDVLLANGAPAESYRDDGNRWLFQNANSGWGLPPQEPYAPVLTGGPVVDAIWQRLLDRAGPRWGLPLTQDADLHLLIDGQRLDAEQQAGDAYVFRIPAAPSVLRIVSRAAAPAELGIARDPRVLGIALRRLAVREGTRFQVLRADDPRLSDGFHDFEPVNGVRWTDGNAVVPSGLYAACAGAFEVVLHLCGSASYLDEGVKQQVA